MVKVAALRDEGLSRAQVDRLVSTGSYRRVGSGWLAGPDAHPDVTSALAQGARLTCVSAARVHGLWTPPHAGVHAYTRRASPPLRHGVIEHPRPRTWPDDEPVAPVPLLLEHSVACLGVPRAAVLFESALNLGLVDPAGAAAVLLRLPRHVRASLMRIRSDAGSGSETWVRWWLESRRVKVRSQVHVPGVGRVDLLVGRRWVIECDSRSHHTGAESYAGDRRRDLEAHRLGLLCTRLTWEQVWLHWPTTESALLDILGRGEHRRHVSLSVDDRAHGSEDR